MGLLAYQEVQSLTGLIASYATPTVSDTFVPGNDVFLHFKNTNAATRLITVVTPRTAVAGLAIPDVTHTIAALTGDVFLGPFPAQHFADPATGLATVTTSVVTNVTVALLKLSTPANS